MQSIRLIISLVLLVCTPVALADGSWYVKPYGGLSSLSDTSGERADGATQDIDVEIDGGFLAGLGVGYRYNERIAAEIAWEYRSNDSETNFADGTLFDDGNYASSIFYLNGYYFLQPRGAWQPYVGAGIGWVQEIDIDLEGLGPEQSFSGDGDIAMQVFGGVSYRLNEAWDINTELRYSRISEVDLDAESGATGAINGLDYDPLSISVGVTYRF